MRELQALLPQALEHEDPEAVQSARWEVPKDASLGDLSCAVAFKLASKRRQPPHQVADVLARELQQRVDASPLKGRIDRFEAVRGFVNAFLSQEALTEVVTEILQDGETYGTTRLGEGRKVLIEFVCANPTGPFWVLWIAC